eukprot:scaffold11499_cov141-Skeletonema_marinoi.AAC.3
MSGWSSCAALCLRAARIRRLGLRGRMVHSLPVLKGNMYILPLRGVSDKLRQSCCIVNVVAMNSSHQRHNFN